VPLLKNGNIIEDPYTRVTEGEELPGEGPILVDLALWQAQRDALVARSSEVGVQLAAGESPAAIAPDLEHIALVALEFPAFTDGRAYSYARLLRERHRFEGELRAVGDVLIEQLHFMDRVGFDSFDMKSDEAAEEWKTAQADMSVWYQPTGDERPTATRLRRS
jgi:uncharacterized protein (DUF934 family)